MNVRLCGCGCGLQLGEKAGKKTEFLPGHDAKLKSALLQRALRDDKAAVDELVRRGWDHFLLTTKVRNLSGECQCGCGSQTSRGSRYLPGHDARHKSTLIQDSLAGSQDAERKLETLGWSNFLVAARHCIEEQQQKAESKAKADARAKESELAKQKKVTQKKAKTTQPAKPQPSKAESKKAEGDAIVNLFKQAAEESKESK